MPKSGSTSVCARLFSPREWTPDWVPRAFAPPWCVEGLGGKERQSRYIGRYSILSLGTKSFPEVDKALWSPVCDAIPNHVCGRLFASFTPDPVNYDIATNGQPPALPPHWTFLHRRTRGTDIYFKIPAHVQIPIHSEEKKIKTSHLRFPTADLNGHTKNRGTTASSLPSPAPATTPLSRVPYRLALGPDPPAMQPPGHPVTAVENQTIYMHPVCICPWHRCNGVTMAAGFALLPLDCRRGRSSGDAGLTLEFGSCWKDILQLASLDVVVPMERQRSQYISSACRAQGCAGVSQWRCGTVRCRVGGWFGRSIVTIFLGR